jgi:fructose-specific phosphotransferase system IIA component
MGGICKRLSPETVLLDPPEEKKEEIIRRLIGILEDSGAITDTETLTRDVFAREEIGTTCIGHGCAVPHAHSEAVESTVFAAARLNPPKDFNACDEESVFLVFLMAGPKSSGNLHIRLLSKLARLLNDASFREDLFRAPTAEEFYRIICTKEG